MHKSELFLPSCKSLLALLAVHGAKLAVLLLPPLYFVESRT